MTLVLAIDPGPTQSAYVIVDSELRPVEFQKVSNGELLSRLETAPRSATRWSQLHACAIEMPAVAMTSGMEVFHTCRHVGMFQHAWINAWSSANDFTTTVDASVRAEDIHLVTRHQVKMHLLGRTNQSSADKLVRAALIAKHGGPISIKKGGELYQVAGDCWAALAVAHTFLDAPRGVQPGQADAARRQNNIIFNTGTDQLDESWQQAKARRAKEKTT